MIIAAAATLGGVWLRWRTHGYRMAVEEAMKDGKLNSDQAARRLRLVNRGGVFLTLGGMALMIAGVSTPAE